MKCRWEPAVDGEQLVITVGQMEGPHPGEGSETLDTVGAVGRQLPAVIVRNRNESQTLCLSKQQSSRPRSMRLGVGIGTSGLRLWPGLHAPISIEPKPTVALKAYMALAVAPPKAMSRIMAIESGTRNTLWCAFELW